MTAVLGLSGLYHDSGAALIVDGVVVAAANEERFSRIKHDATLPLLSARYCLEQAGLQMSDVDAIVWYEKPLRKFERIIVQQVLHFPRSMGAFRRSTFNWLTEKLWVKSALVAELGVPAGRLYFSEHHLSHAASAFYASDFERAAILTVDGVGEWATTSLWQGGPEGIRCIGEVDFPHSIGLVYSAFTAYLGFQVNDGEFKVMGMAPYGQPRYKEQVARVLQLKPDGGFEVDLDYVCYHYSAEHSYTGKLEELLGPARFPGSPFDPADPTCQRYADIAASVQSLTEDALLGLAQALHARTGLTDLCFAGGVALNSVANRHLLERGPFRRLVVQPAAGDAGGALGAAWWCWHMVLGQPRCRPLDRPGLGQSWSDSAIHEMVTDLRLPAQTLDEQQRCARAAEDIAAGRVIGWAQGRFEWGPRALGHRSILADPQRADMKDRINASVKFREPFRPFAPSMPSHRVRDYVALPAGGEQPADWMLLVAPVQDQARDLLPATTHVDGSARVQTVRAEANPLYARLLDEVESRTGHPVVLNTSFNLKGEPMVSSPVQALATFHRSGLDALYLGPCRIERKELDSE
jgi:carbamoyltransferase